VLLVALPGSPAAVQLALQQILLPELPHLLFELRKHAPPSDPAHPEKASHGKHGKAPRRGAGH
jgi:hypothetical protein